MTAPITGLSTGTGAVVRKPSGKNPKPTSGRAPLKNGWVEYSRQSLLPELCPPAAVRLACGTGVSNQDQA
jgi:hypothetical protein